MDAFIWQRIRSFADPVGQIMLNLIFGGPCTIRPTVKHAFNVAFEGNLSILRVLHEQLRVPLNDMFARYNTVYYVNFIDMKCLMYVYKKVGPHVPREDSSKLLCKFLVYGMRNCYNELSRACNTISDYHIKYAPIPGYIDIGPFPIEFISANNIIYYFCYIPLTGDTLQPFGKISAISKPDQLLLDIFHWYSTRLSSVPADNVIKSAVTMYTNAFRSIKDLEQDILKINIKRFINAFYKLYPQTPVEEPYFFS